VALDPVEEKIVGGIIVPSGSQEPPMQGTVSSVGPKWLDAPVKAGDRVLISKHGGTEIVIGRKKYVFVTVKELLAVLS